MRHQNYEFLDGNKDVFAEKNALVNNGHTCLDLVLILSYLYFDLSLKITFFNLHSMSIWKEM